MRALFVVFVLCFASGGAATPIAGVEMLIIEKVQSAKSLTGVALDPAGEPIDGVEVVETASDCDTSIRATHSDASGRWTLPARPHQKFYYLRFNKPAFNPVCIQVKLSRFGEKQLVIKLPLST